MSKSDPAVCPTGPNQIIRYNGRMHIPASEFVRLPNLEDGCEAFEAANLPKIVPEGTPLDQIPVKAADWVAAVRIYDCDTLSDTAFNTLVQLTPFDPAIELVRYPCANPVHDETRYAYSGKHAWSAITCGGGKSWHFCGITGYDGNGSANHPRYLDTGEELQKTASSLSVIRPIGKAFQNGIRSEDSVLFLRAFFFSDWQTAESDEEGIPWHPRKCRGQSGAEVALQGGMSHLHRQNSRQFPVLPGTAPETEISKKSSDRC